MYRLAKLFDKSITTNLHIRFGIRRRNPEGFEIFRVYIISVQTEK